MDLGIEDLMQIDLLQELPPSGCYENIITAIDVFSIYAFAYLVNTAKVILVFMTRHAYKPTLLLADRGSVFITQVMHEVAEILVVNLKHATKEHAQTFGVLERAHATIKTSFKKTSSENRKQWHKYLSIAILNYNTIYHSSIDCEPSRVFHGRVRDNFLDHKPGLRFNPKIPQNQNAISQKHGKCHAVVHQIQEVIRQKRKSFTFKTERLLLHTSAKSRPSRVKNTVP